MTSERSRAAVSRSAHPLKPIVSRNGTARGEQGKHAGKRASWLDSRAKGRGDGRREGAKVPRGTTRCFSLLRVYKQSVGLNTTRGRNITLAIPFPPSTPGSIPVFCLATTPGGSVWRKRCLWRPQAASPVELSATSALSQPRLRAKGFSVG